MILFFLKLQQDYLEKSILKSGDKRKNKKHITRSDSFDVMSKANDACSMHNSNIMTRKGWVLSLTPFTQQFKTRLVAARSLSVARNEIRLINKEIAASKPLVRDKPIRKCKSDSEVCIQRKQYIQVLQPKRRVKEAEDIISQLKLFNNPRLLSY